MELKGKVALVTGSTRGIGRAIADLLAQRGVKVITNSSQSENKSRGLEFDYLKADVSNNSDLEVMFKHIKDKYGKLDILINNAGVYLKEDLIFSEDYQVYEKFHKVNGWGVYLCSNLASKLMKKGKIVNISSIYGIQPNETSMIASGVKSEVESYTKSFARKFKGRIEVNSVAPGYVNTFLVRKSLTKKEILNVVAKNSRKRLITAQEISKAVVFLLENDGITGQTIVVDDGCLL